MCIYIYRERERNIYTHICTYTSLMSALRAERVRGTVATG